MKRYFVTLGWGPWEDEETCPVTCGAGLKRQNRECFEGATAVEPNLCGDDIYTRTVDCRAEVPCTGKKRKIWFTLIKNLLYVSQTLSTFLCSTVLNITELSVFADNRMSKARHTVRANMKHLFRTGWTPWSECSECTQSCNGGFCVQTRTCEADGERVEDAKCEGNSTKIVECNTQPCASNYIES